MEKLGLSDMSSEKLFLRLVVVLAVTAEVINAFPGVGYPGVGFSKPQNQNGKFFKIKAKGMITIAAGPLDGFSILTFRI